LWTTDKQLNQYRVEDNPPNGIGKYPCDEEKNGKAIFHKVILGDIKNANGESDLESEITRANGLFSNSDLRGACFRKADLRNANLNGAKLQGANLYKADLSGASMVDADLSDAILDCANLRGADLTRAKLVDTNLHRALLGRSFFNHADLRSARFEPIELPPLFYLWETRGLESVRWEQNPGGLFALREELVAAGRDFQARQITYALEHQSTTGKVRNLFENPLNGSIGVLRLIFVDLTTGYGLYPFRSLSVLIFLIIVFASIYYFFLGTNCHSSFIYKINPKNRIEINREDFELAESAKAERPSPKGLERVAFALQFSVLSAFDIGWRELNVGLWLTRLQRREYQLKAIGWVRFLAGVQSLTSVYLLAIWAMTYFGRPFG
jgi:hypothetical protein